MSGTSPRCVLKKISARLGDSGTGSARVFCTSSYFFKVSLRKNSFPLQG
ncbi:Uncharacterized protein dnm_068900 [Desulfonema magnum]|uniref:Uncharacterized protein n=1 Tax=Desulfonema magnum TaxID=45655 RepID=A0A975BSZ5_9BACT|nr:Uncharacterized protein dnm_068900 [Desulfonema magnum]